MSPFVFLIVPVVVIAVASLFLYLRGRQPTNLQSGVQGFQREMQALSPDGNSRKPRRFDSGEPGGPTAPRPGG